MSNKGHFWVSTHPAGAAWAAVIHGLDAAVILPSGCVTALA
jgi:hypothetical protein